MSLALILGFFFSIFSFYIISLEMSLPEGSILYILLSVSGLAVQAQTGHGKMQALELYTDCFYFRPFIMCNTRSGLVK